MRGSVVLAVLEREGAASCPARGACMEGGGRLPRTGGQDLGGPGEVCCSWNVFSGCGQWAVWSPKSSLRAKSAMPPFGSHHITGTPFWCVSC